MNYQLLLGGIGLEEQSGVTVAARITDSNGLRVWPSDRTFNFFTIPGSLAKGEEFTVDPSTAGPDWKWGSDLGPGIYRMHIQALRDDDVQVPDESRAKNFRTLTLVLGAALLTGEQWSMGDGWSSGSYIWDFPVFILPPSSSVLLLLLLLLPKMEGILKLVNCPRFEISNA